MEVYRRGMTVGSKGGVRRYACLEDAEGIDRLFRVKHGDDVLNTCHEHGVRWAF